MRQSGAAAGVLRRVLVRPTGGGRGAKGVNTERYMEGGRWGDRVGGGGRTKPTALAVYRVCVMLWPRRIWWR